jgi:hypothetical protein
MKQKQRYTLRVRRGSESIGEYDFNATPAGVAQLILAIRPEFKYDILDGNGIFHDGEFTQKQARP